MRWLSLFLLSWVLLFFVLGLGYLDEAAERPFTIFAILLSLENMVFMLEQFQFVKNALLLDFLSLPEIFNIGSVFEFFLSFLVKFVDIPGMFLGLKSLVDILLAGVGDFRHGEVGVLVGFEGDGLVPVEEVELVEGKLIAHIIVY